MGDPPATANTSHSKALTMRNDPDAPMSYELRIAGRLDEHWSAWFGGLKLTPKGDGTTTLSGVVTDQAQLHGLLTKIRDLGVTLISVTPIDESAAVHGNPRSQ